MRKYLSCVMKDTNEYLRGRKSITSAFIMISISLTLLLSTMFLPSLFGKVSEKAPELISDVSAFSGLLDQLFPRDIKGNMGMLAAYINNFYSIYVVLSCYNILSAEMVSGKWYLPISCGYNPLILCVSKLIVYGLGFTFPVFVIYNLHYWIGKHFLYNNANYLDVLMCSFVVSFTVLTISSFTILLSNSIKYGILNALSIIATVLAIPDILSLVKFGKYMPTYLLTFSCTISSNYWSLIIPVFEVLGLLAFLLYIRYVKRGDMDYGIHRD